MNIPFVDLKAQYESIKPEIDAAIADVISKTAFIGGAYPICPLWERVMASRRTG